LHHADAVVSCVPIETLRISQVERQVGVCTLEKKLGGDPGDLPVRAENENLGYGVTPWSAAQSWGSTSLSHAVTRFSVRRS
jgi:hypothetical protein